jgi:hypothetical protein
LQLVRREDCMGRDPDWGSYYTDYLRSIEAAALSFAVQTTLAPVHNADEIEKAIGSLSREPGGALIVLPSAPITAHNHVIVRAAARHRIPAVYHFRRFVADGGLAFYGTDLTDFRANCFVCRSHTEAHRAGRLAGAAADHRAAAKCGEIALILLPTTILAISYVV